MTFYKMILHSLAHQILKTKTNKRKQKNKTKAGGTGIVTTLTTEKLKPMKIAQNSLPSTPQIAVCNPADVKPSCLLVHHTH